MLLQNQEALNLFKSCKANEGGELFAFLTINGKASSVSAIKAAKALSMANDGREESLSVADLKGYIYT